MALLCVAMSGFSQSRYDYRKVNKPFFIDDWINQDIPLGRFIHYRDATATLHDFKDKLVILDFWFTHCGDCIAELPVEDSLQKMFSNDIQFIPVTFESKNIVETFLAGWQKRTGIQLSLPVIVEDTLLRKAFRQLSNPHYVWILPDGKIVGQTAQQFLTAENIRGLLTEIAKRKAIFSRLKQEEAEHPVKNKNN